MIEIKHKKTGEVLHRVDLESRLRAMLSNIDLAGADLTETDLDGADLRHAILLDVDFSLASLQDADLSGAHLIGAKLSQTFLSGSNLRGANLFGANLRATELSGVNLTGATFGKTVIVECTDLHKARGLAEITHQGPSHLDAVTLRACIHALPDIFLWGVGYTNKEIATLRDLYAANPTQFESCFISYSGKDEEFASRLRSRMREANLRVWYAPEDMKGGQKIHEQIDRAIQFHDRLLLVLSEASLQSEWVMTEIRKARRAERKENRRKLFPIRLVPFDVLRDWECFDADSGKYLDVEVREYFVPDFSNWKDHDAFETAFARLLADLRAAEA